MISEVGQAVFRAFQATRDMSQLTAQSPGGSSYHIEVWSHAGFLSNDPEGRSGLGLHFLGHRSTNEVLPTPQKLR